MCRRRRRAPQLAHTVSNDELMLGTDDRNKVTETDEARSLAVQIIDQAVVLAAQKGTGEEYSVTITEPHPEVHHMELMLALMILAPQHGLKLQYMTDNTVYFEA